VYTREDTAGESATHEAPPVKNRPHCERRRREKGRDFEKETYRPTKKIIRKASTEKRRKHGSIGLNQTENGRNMTKTWENSH